MAAASRTALKASTFCQKSYTLFLLLGSSSRYIFLHTTNSTKGLDMKKLAVVLAAMVAGTVGFGAAASAQYGASEFEVTVTPTTVVSGGEVVVTVDGCTPGERLDVELGGTSNSVTCGATGTGTTSVTAPQALGPHTGTVTASASPDRATFIITVVAAQSGSLTGSLPSTGSGGLATTTSMALGLLAVGAGLVFVTGFRRRQTAAR